jgi:SPP1 gp7 family putative phage head morphogenesis protein
MSLDDKFKQGEKAAEKLTNQAEKEIIKAYRERLKEIRTEIGLAYEKYASDGVLTMAEMQKYGRLVKLEEAIAKEVTKLTGTEIRTTKKAIKEVFQESYYRVAWTLETGAEVSLGFALLKPEAVEAAILNPLDRITWPERVKDNAHILNRQIREEITRGVIQGYSYDKTARAVKDRLDIGASKAIRIVQTETHRAQSQGTQAAFEKAAAKGLVFKRVWVATLDGRTRDRHRALDGQKVDVDQPFEYSGMEAMYPGGFGIPSMDINCRCSVRAEIEGMEPQLRRARDPITGKNVVIENTTYEDWAKDRDIKPAVKVKADIAPSEVKMDNKSMIINKIEPTDFISPNKIEPVNPVTDVEKFKAIAYQLKTEGWEGRPVLAYNIGPGSYQALTGSHRIYAAIDADVQVPIVEISSLRKLNKAEQELFDSLPTLLDDEQRYDVLKQLRDKKVVSEDVFSLIEREMDTYQEKGYTGLANKYDTLIKKEKEEAENLLAEAERKQAEKLAKQLTSPAKRELDNYLGMLKTKYENIWAEATDKELEKLESLERAVYKK